MLRAIPFKKPTRIGFDRKSASAPNRKNRAAIQNTPARKASVMESETYRSALPAANGPTAAATIAQVAASGPTINCRDVPNNAYATSGRILAYNPNPGLNPASCAYATPTGNATAATERPATISLGRSVRRYVIRSGIPGAILERRWIHPSAFVPLG